MNIYPEYLFTFMTIHGFGVNEAGAGKIFARIWMTTTGEHPDACVDWKVFCYNHLPL